MYAMVGPEVLAKTNQNKDLERLTARKTTVVYLTFLNLVV